jgi:Xaa-Pro aminopeptidase
MEENPVTLLPGMVLSNEPAVYVEGQYGIRTENVVLVEEWKHSRMNEFYGFRTLTLVPIDTTCVDWELLGAEETAWVKEYNRGVYEKLAPLLDAETAQWLAGKCK